MVHHRQQLLNWLSKNLQDRVLLNALEYGTVELLGGFNKLPGSSTPGWIVKLITANGKKHFVAIASNPLCWFRIKSVPWKNWDGDRSSNPLYQGDNPRRYLLWKIMKNNQ